MGVVSPTTTWGSDDVLSPDYLWWASPRSKGLQTEIVLMRGDGSENHSIFKADGRLNGPVIWLNNNYLFVRLYNQQVDRNNLYLISLTDNTAQEIFLPGLDTSAFDVAQVSFRPNADPPFGGASVGQFPSPTPYPTHAPTTGDPLTVLQTLTTQYANDILSGSGWLHLRTRQFVNDEPGTLPNGALMPNPAIWDDWYQFDDQLQVRYEVNLYTDENGNVNQVSIQRDGQSYNLTLGIRGDRSLVIRESFHEIQFTMAVTVGLVVLVIFLFLRNASATLIPTLALPFSILGTFGVMYLCGYSLNNLSMMALILSVGFVVDDAIVMLENIVRHIEHGETPMQAAFAGSKEIWFTIVSMTTSLAAVFIPILFMGGVLGKLFKEFAVSIVAAVVFSGFVSVTLTPMLCSRLLKA
ncbi:MAG: efflux RND transporter permease subunit, partial [Anaerolineales bacterium]|nr:efflux RND transporter permease subunit [Anaerolineales bacterium]